MLSFFVYWFYNSGLSNTVDRELGKTEVLDCIASQHLVYLTDLGNLGVPQKLPFIDLLVIISFVYTHRVC